MSEAQTQILLHRTVTQWRGANSQLYVALNFTATKVQKHAISFQIRTMVWWAFEKVWGPPRWKSAAFWNGSCSAHWYSVTNRFCCIIPSTVRGRFRRAVCTYEHQALSELKRTLQLFGSVMQSSSNKQVYFKWFDRKIVRNWNRQIRMKIWGLPLGRPKSRWQDNIKMDFEWSWKGVHCINIRIQVFSGATLCWLVYRQMWRNPYKTSIFTNTVMRTSQVALH